MDNNDFIIDVLDDPDHQVFKYKHKITVQTEND